MSIKCILFDFDGTLINSNDAVVSMLHLASTKHRGVPFSEDELNEILGKPIHDQMSFLSEEKAEELVTYYRQEYKKVRDELTKSYEGMEEALDRLKELGIKIGIVSNKGRNGIDHGIEMFKLEKWIDVSISKDDVINTKPNPEGIFKALKKLGLSEDDAKDTIFVGDSGHDIECGKNAGCKTILVDWTLIDKKVLLPLNPDFVAKTPAEIVDIVIRLSTESSAKLSVLSVEEVEHLNYLKGYVINYKTKSGKERVWELASRGSKDRLEAEIFEHKKFTDGTMMFATNRSHDQVVLLREYRVSAGRYVYMLPAGLAEENEEPKITAVREFKEETGMDFEPVKVDKSRYISVGIVNECATVVYGYFEGIPSKHHQEDNEDADILIVDRKQAIEILENQEVTLRTALLLEHFFKLNSFFYK